MRSRNELNDIYEKAVMMIRAKGSYTEQDILHQMNKIYEVTNLNDPVYLSLYLDLASVYIWRKEAKIARYGAADIDDEKYILCRKALNQLRLSRITEREVIVDLIRDMVEQTDLKDPAYLAIYVEIIRILRNKN